MNNNSFLLRAKREPLCVGAEINIIKKGKEKGNIKIHTGLASFCGHRFRRARGRDEYLHL